MKYFLDSSALVKRYVQEPGSLSVRRLFSHRRVVAVCRITYAEAVAAFARRSREGEFSPAQLAQIVRRLEEDLADFEVAEVRQNTMSFIPALCARHALRGYDAVQLSAALSVRQAGIAVDFWTMDLALRDAALAEGLRATPFA